MKLGGLGCAAFAALAVSCAMGSEDRAVVDSSLTSDGGSVIVFLRDMANVDAAGQLSAKEDRGRFVYTTLARHAERTQADLLRFLDAAHARTRRFHLVNAVLVENASAGLVRALAARPDVARIMSDREVALVPAHPRPEELAGAEESGISATNATKVWSELGVRGADVVIAGQDSGYDWTHPALKKSYRGWDGSVADHRYSWHDAIHTGTTNPCGFDAAAPCDDDGHGSHTLGTMVGEDGPNKIGMAPAARWIGCRNMNLGVGKPSTYLECFEWLLAPYPQGGDPRTDGRPEMAPHVINNSWGCGEDESCHGREFVQALDSLKAAGIVVVVAAGNSGSACGSINTQPASVSGATISVGAYLFGDGVSFSSRGPSVYDGKIGPDLVAPGIDVRSSIPGGGYDKKTGTSMSSPHVAGAAALVLSAVPSLRGRPDLVTEALTKSAKPMRSSESCGGVPGSSIPNNTLGWGMLDAYAAVRRAQQMHLVEGSSQ